MSHSSDASSPTDLPWPQIVRQAVHDMRTPLSSMLTTVAVMRQSSSAALSTEQNDKMLGLLERQIQELSVQLGRLLETPASYLKDGSGKAD